MLFAESILKICSVAWKSECYWAEFSIGLGLPVGLEFVFHSLLDQLFDHKHVEVLTELKFVIFRLNFVCSLFAKPVACIYVVLKTLVTEIEPNYVGVVFVDK